MRTNARRALYSVLVVVALVLAAEFTLVDAAGGVRIYAVVSGSMSPTLGVGDLVVARSVPFGDIHVGDVVVFNSPTRAGSCSDLIVVHRVVGVASDGGLITQGDNRATNPTPDEPTSWPYVTADCVRGVAVLSIPYVGGASTLLPPPYDYLLIAVLVLLIFLVAYLGDEDEAGPGSEGSARATRTARRSPGGRKAVLIFDNRPGA
ncbi:MAG: signal peptidase I [Nitrososphaerales archaeon]